MSDAKREMAGEWVGNKRREDIKEKSERARTREKDMQRRRVSDNEKAYLNVRYPQVTNTVK